MSLRAKSKNTKLISRKLPKWVFDVTSHHSLQTPLFKAKEQFYTYLRSNLKLSKDSKNSEKALNVCTNIELFFSKFTTNTLLDNIKIIHFLTKEGCGPNKTYKERRTALGLINKQKIEKHIKMKNMSPTQIRIKKATDLLVDGANSGRGIEWCYRTEVALKEAIKEGWYCLFGTYTVDPACEAMRGFTTRNQLWQDTPIWDRFVKKMKSRIAESMGMTRKSANWETPNSNWFKYMAVLEHGKSGLHPHIHCIWMLKSLPKSWLRDPNRAWMEYPVNVNIEGASTLWPHGRQTVVRGVLCSGSYFKDNWIIPLDKRTLKPVEIGGVGPAAYYVCKYMQKGDRSWSHRIKATRNLGLSRVREKVGEISSLAMIRTLASRPEYYGQSAKMQILSKCPMGLLRRTSKQELTKRLHLSRNSQDKNILKEIWTNQLSNFFKNLMTDVRDGLRLHKLSIRERFNYFSNLIGVATWANPCEIETEKIYEWLQEHFEKEATTLMTTFMRGKSYAEC